MTLESDSVEEGVDLATRRKKKMAQVRDCRLQLDAIPSSPLDIYIRFSLICFRPANQIGYHRCYSVSPQLLKHRSVLSNASRYLR